MYTDDTGQELTDSDLDSMFQEVLDDAYGDVSIAGMEYCTSRVLREVDPIAYRCAYLDWLDSEQQDDRIIDHDSCNNETPVCDPAELGCEVSA